MAISLVGSGTWGVNAGTGAPYTVTPGLPTGLAAGDIMVLFVHLKTKAATIATPSGWTYLTDGVSSNGAAYAADTGDTRTYIFYKFWASGDTAPTVTLSGGTTGNTGNNQLAHIISVRPASGSGITTPLGAVLAQSTSTLNWSGTTTALGQWNTGDYIITSASWMSDAPSPTAMAVSQTGATLGTGGSPAAQVGASGSDMAAKYQQRPVTAGGTSTTTTATVTMNATAYGTHAVVRLMETTPPNAPTGLTATADADSINLSWTAPATGGAPTSYRVTRTTANYVSDGTFDTSAAVAKWSAGANTTLSYDATDLAMRLTATGATSGAQTTWMVQQVPVAAGDVIHFGTSEKSVSGGPTLSRVVKYYQANGSTALTTVFDASDPATNVYTPITSDYTVPSDGTANASPRLGFTATASGNALNVDDVSVTVTRTFTVTAPTVTYDDTTAVAGTAYTYTVAAVNGGGTSTESNSDTATVAASGPTFTFGVRRAGKFR